MGVSWTYQVRWLGNADHLMRLVEPGATRARGQTGNVFDSERARMAR
jgi:hypothetical protein